MFELFLSKNKIDKISAQEAKDRLASHKNVLLLDVRTTEEYHEIHIPNSISLPLDQLKTGIEKIAKDKDAEIIVYCLSGMRAANGCRQLAAMGYTNVANMGGINSWEYETERGS
jgi:phage shock protein E